MTRLCLSVLGLLMLTAGCATISPVSVDLRYQPDAPSVIHREALSGARIGVPRFLDPRPRIGDDLHSSSYVAEDSSFRVGVTWAGRTFADAVSVIRDLLVEELRQAGLQVVPLDSVIGPTDADSARQAGEAAQCDFVLGGALQELISSRTGENTYRAIILEIGLFDLSTGNVLLRMPFSDSHRDEIQSGPRENVHQLFNRNFRRVAHRVVGKVAEHLNKLIDSAAAESLGQPQPDASPQPVPPSAIGE